MKHRNFFFSVAVLTALLVTLAGNAQVRVELGTLQTIIGGNISVPFDPLPSLWVRPIYNPSPTGPAVFDLGIMTKHIRFSEKSIGNMQLDLLTGRGIFFTSYYNNSSNPALPYLKYETDSYANPNDVFYIYANELSFNHGTCIDLVETSDGRYKKEVTELSKSLSQLSKLRGVSYRRDFTGHSVYGKEKGLLTDSLGQPINALSLAADTAKHIGFIAQELQEVFPELVKADEDGNLAIHYTGLIPVIVEAMKEQQAIVDKQGDVVKAQSAKITELQAELSALREGKTPPQAKGIEVQNAFLYQNAPNPFNIATTIRYFLGEETANAAIYIFDMQGKLIETRPVTGAGEGAIEISASGLQPGMYLYSLLVNNQEVDTKRMVITE